MNGGFNGKMIYKSTNGRFNGNIWEYHLRNEGHVWLPEVIISAIPGWHILFTVALSFSTPFSAGFSAFSPGKDLRLATFRNLSATPAKLFRNHLKSFSHACFRAFMETEKTYQKWSTNLGAHRFTSFRKRAFFHCWVPWVVPCVPAGVLVWFLGMGIHYFPHALRISLAKHRGATGHFMIPPMAQGWPSWPGSPTCFLWSRLWPAPATRLKAGCVSLVGK